MSNIRLVILSAFLFVAFISGSITVRAEGESLGGGTKEVVELAKVAVYEARIVSQDKGVLIVGFDIANDSDSAQSNIQYGIDVIQKNDAGQTRVDSFVSQETLSLAGHSSLYREVTYQVPEQLSGRYEIWAVSRMTSGMMLGLGYAGVATFISDSSGVRFRVDTCAMTVGGDTNTYALVQGVDVETTETLNLSCSIENYFDNEVTVTPSFTTNFRTSHGEVVSTEPYTATPITLAKGEKRTVLIPVPKATTPQAYDVSTVLQDAQGKVVSNKVIGHYVLRGASATVQTATLNKMSYKAGEELTADIAWTPSADSFPGSRKGATDIGEVTMILTVVNEDGETCIEPVTSTIKGIGQMVTLTTPVTRECEDPEMSVALKDSTGKVLDERTFPKPENVVEEIPIPQMNTHHGSVWNIWSIGQWILLIVTVDSLMILYILLTVRGVMRGEIKIEDVISKKN